MIGTTTTRTTRWRLIAAGAITAVVSLGVCEALGWPFLVQPIQRWLSATLERRISFNEDPAAHPRVIIHLLGGLAITAPYIEIGAPAWSAAPYLLLARDARLQLSYADLWRARGDAPLRIQALRAAKFDGYLERLADGRASWEFGMRSDTGSARLPAFELPAIDSGTLTYRDALTGFDLNATLSLLDSAAPLAGGGTRGLTLQGSGSYRTAPLKIALRAQGVLPVSANHAPTLPVTLEAQLGKAELSFKGTTTDALHFAALTGRFSLAGMSLADVGEPVHVTLPTTGPFRAVGDIAKDGNVWTIMLEKMSIGSSQLAGRFTYNPSLRVPLLTGRLTGTKLLLADLGPAVGARVPQPEQTKPSAARQLASARVLPDRPFNLPALRAMDADVQIEIENFDLGTRVLEPLKPLRAHLMLTNGVLTFSDLIAHTGQGQFGGTLQLDGRTAQALWTADVRWAGIRLERWIRQARPASAPPYLTGDLNGQARVVGQGKSTASILSHLNGGVRVYVLNGTISHLAVEAAGLDIAQGLGVFIKGDNALQIQCTAADLVAEQGVVSPRVFVLNTSESTVFLAGSISLATETLDLTAIVTPKDFSPLALRTPLRLRGSFADPDVGLDKGKLGTRLGASVLLALVNPLAALIPLFDIGNSADAKRDADDCRALSERIAARPELPPPTRGSAAR